MKRVIFIFSAAIIAVSVVAQGLPTKFLGIPIDGTKQEMIQKIQEKGFSYDQEHDCLIGEFNGAQVHVFVVTNGNKVWRVMVSEVNKYPEGEIRMRFNELLRQFRKNKKYIPLNDEDFRLSSDEDLSYEMTVHKKRYSAEFLQITHEIDTAYIYATLLENLKAKSEQMGVENAINELNESQLQNLLLPMFKLACLYAFEKNEVWFIINQFYGKYDLTIYYDNGYNKADGEYL